MYAALKNQVYNWLFQLRGPEAGIIVLVQRRVFILPTRHGLTFAAVLLLMLTGSINYNLSLGFVLTFLLAALAINAMIYTFRNLANLRVSGGRARPVYAGDTARFAVNLENTGDNDRYSIGLTRDKRSPNSSMCRRAARPWRHRLFLRRVAASCARAALILFTRYPLGLYYAWSYLELDMHCIVYPRPAPPGLPLPPRATSARRRSGARPGPGGFLRAAAVSPRRFAAPHCMEGRRARSGAAHQAIRGPRRHRVVARLGPASVPSRRRGKALAACTLGARCPRGGSVVRPAPSGQNRDDRNRQDAAGRLPGGARPVSRR